MPKSETVLSLDVEATGPIPGPWWMCSLGLCRTDRPEDGLRILLKPLERPGLSRPETAAAMRIVAQGLPESEAWDEGQPEAANIARIRAWFEREGLPPTEALERVDAWIREQAPEGRAMLVGAPVTFDFLWIYWYWWHLREEMPPFGFAGLDLRSYFMGSHGVGALGTGKERYLKHYPNDYRHSHDPLDDARQQGALWRDMVAARAARGPIKSRKGSEPGKNA